MIAEDIGLWQFHLLRSAMALPLLVLRRRGLRAGAPAAALGRVSAGRCGVQAASMLLYFGSLPMMPIAQVGAALFTAPIWVLLFAAALLAAADRAAADAGGGARLRRGAGDAAARFRHLSTVVTLMPVGAGALYGLSNTC